MLTPIQQKRVDVHGDKGQGMVEYAFILCFVSVAAVTAMGVLAVFDGGYFQGIVTALRGLVT